MKLQVLKREVIFLFLLQNKSVLKGKMSFMRKWLKKWWKF